MLERKDFLEKLKAAIDEKRQSVIKELEEYEKRNAKQILEEKNKVLKDRLETRNKLYENTTIITSIQEAMLNNKDNTVYISKENTLLSIFFSPNLIGGKPIEQTSNITKIIFPNEHGNMPPHVFEEVSNYFSEFGFSFRNLRFTNKVFEITYHI